MTARYTLRGAAFGRAQDEYIRLRESLSPMQARERLNIGPSAHRKFEEAYRSERYFDGPDSSCPAFARHAEHVEAVTSAGGFRRLVLRRVHAPGFPA